MKKNKFFKPYSLLLLCLLTSMMAKSQNNCYWQQRVSYKMNIDFDVNKHQFVGNQQLTYYNNSGDTLKKVFFHLYFNAFQPESMMDKKSRTINDPDRRVESRISKLNKKEIGYHHIKDLSQEGRTINFKVEGTVLEADLNVPILPNTSTIFDMLFESQVPVQIRRSGRNNAEGISYSMSQWYPKMAEYDKRGWHAHPYVGREFYAPWGDFEINISINNSYMVAATGTLQNSNEIGYGYETETIEKKKKKGKKLNWHFKAENVHDFVWTADPDYVHNQTQVPNGPILHFFYQENDQTKAWEQLPEYTVKAFQFIEKNYGKYPYDHYSIIQGGDGGMEYPMATLITGHRNLKSLVSVTVHEVLHTWYQGLLATNESYFAWMDEGFTTYASSETMAHLFKSSENNQRQNYEAYFSLAQSETEEPLSTHADHFLTNRAYGLGSYYKGAVALAQMNYLVGKETAKRALEKYYYEWRFKHPDANDFIRVFEKESGLELDWYLDYWINTTHTIDYAIEQVEEKKDKTVVMLQKIGQMPMPIDLTVTTKNGVKTWYYIPLGIMRGEKINDTEIKRVTLKDWYWTHPTYVFEIDTPLDQIETLQIDESGYLADVNSQNNSWKQKE